MGKSLFEFKDYRAYLIQALPTKGNERGARLRLASALGVQKSLVSAVLYGTAELSLEQAFRVSTFLSHSNDEREYFLLLVQKARAGSKELEAHFSKKIEEISENRREIRKHINVKEALSEIDQLVYYSSWHYTAVHMCLMVPALQSSSSIGRYLGIPQTVVSHVLEFFVKTGLAQQHGNIYSAGPTRIHIASDSPFISKHHVNWRVQAIQSLDRNKREDLHYSLVMSISPHAVEKIREILLSSIQETEPILRDAKDEKVYALTIDLFEVLSASNN